VQIATADLLAAVDRLSLIARTCYNECAGYDQAAIMRLYDSTDWPSSRDAMRNEIRVLGERLAVAARERSLDSTPFDLLVVGGEQHLRKTIVLCQTLRTCVAVEAGGAKPDYTASGSDPETLAELQYISQLGANQQPAAWIAFRINQERRRRERERQEPRITGTAKSLPTLADDGPWSEPDTPSRWAKRFGVSWDTLKRRFAEGAIRHKKLSSKSYQIHVNDLPKQ
jgi:hypothetical protein